MKQDAPVAGSIIPVFRDLSFYGVSEVFHIAKGVIFDAFSIFAAIPERYPFLRIFFEGFHVFQDFRFFGKFWKI